MSLRIKQTLEAFVDKISRNSTIMTIMKLPTILDTDSDLIKRQKRLLVIDKVITKTAQIPETLGDDFIPVTIDEVKYEDFGGIRLTISLIQSKSYNSYLFGNPQVEINVYYDNTSNPDEALSILDELSDEFSGKNLEVKFDNNTKTILKELKCEGQTSQVSNINNYERIGIRFSFYATLYKI